MSAIEIPNKASFKIGEVAELLALEAYVLRYWETEFDQLKPRKTRTGQRAYARKDVELLLEIKRLLYEDMYTIAGARKQLDAGRKRVPTTPLGDESQLLGELSGLKARTRELEMANQQLQGSLDVSKAQLDGTQGRVEELRNDLLSARAEVERTHLTLMELREENDTQAARIQELEHIDETLLFLPSAHDESVRLQGEVEALQIRLAELENELTRQTEVGVEAERARQAAMAEQDAMAFAVAESQALQNRVMALEAELAGVVQNQASRQQARRSALTLVRRELEHLNRLAVG